jgi:hypothetical protein
VRARGLSAQSAPPPAPPPPSHPASPGLQSLLPPSLKTPGIQLTSPSDRLTARVEPTLGRSPVNRYLEAFGLLGADER